MFSLTILKPPFRSFNFPFSYSFLPFPLYPSPLLLAIFQPILSSGHRSFLFVLTLLSFLSKYFNHFFLRIINLFLPFLRFFITFFFLFCTFSTYKLQIFILTLKHFLILCLLFFSLFFSFSSSFKHYSFLLAFFLTYPSQTSFLSLSLHFLSVFPFSFPPGLTLSSFTFFFLFPSRSSPSHQFPSFSLSFSFSPS